jgi:hypothetical protein
MAFLKEKLGRWTLPVILSAGLVAGLATSPAIGGLNFVTGKKVNKTIRKKTNATELRITGAHEAGTPFDINSPGALVGSLQLKPGSYLITSTFRIQYAANQIVKCQLGAGSATDSADTFSSAFASDNAALSVTTTLANPSAAQLRCAKANAGTEGTIKAAEITALKIPRASNTTAP